MLAACRCWPALRRALLQPRCFSAEAASAALSRGGSGLRSKPLASFLDAFVETEEEEEERGQGDLGGAVDEAAAADPALQRCVRVAVVGAPNAGKSTLTNALVGRLVTAVSKKTNTTRAEALGALTVGDTQLLLYDTPGVVAPEGWHGDAHAARVTGAWRAAAAADVVLFLVDAHRQVTAPDPRVPALFARAAQELLAAASRGGGADGGSYVPPHSLLVLNKADALPGASRRPALRRLLDDLAPLHDFSAAFGISALQRSGVAALTAHLLALGKAARWPLPPERATDRGPAAQALAATQGALFERLHAEVPYHVSLRHVSWEDFRDGSARVEQVLLVPSDAVRKIVVGSGGAAIGQIGIAARKACERLFGRRVHLILRVKVARGRRAALAEGPDAALDTEGIVAEQSERMP